MKTKTLPITLFVPFTKIERRAEDDALIVEGYCFVNPTVPGDRYSIKRSAMEAATPDYLKFPAVREMHQPIAAGTGLEVIWDERGCLLRSECVDEGTKKKIEKKVLRGYSVGVNPVSVNRADEVESLTWVETSYVDRPKDPDAIFLYRAADFNPEQEVEVEVVEDVAADAGPPPADAATASAPAEVGEPLHLTPDGIASPADQPTAGASPVPAADTGAGGDSSTEEGQRATLRALLVSTGLSEEDAAQRAAGVDLGSSVVQALLEAAAERSLGAPVVPIQGPPTEPTADIEDVDEALGGDFPEGYRVEQAATGMWCAYGGGVKLGEFATAAEARARVREAMAAMAQPTGEDADDARMARAQTSGTVPTRENLEGKPKPAPKPKPIKRAEGNEERVAGERYTLRRMGEDCHSIHDATRNAFVTKFFDGRVILRFETADAAEAYLAERRAALKDEKDKEWPSVVAQRAIEDSEKRWATFKPATTANVAEVKRQDAEAVEVEVNITPPEAPRAPRSFTEVIAAGDVSTLANSVESAYWALCESLWSIMDAGGDDALAAAKASIQEYATYLGGLLESDTSRADLVPVLARLMQPPAAPETVSRTDVRDDLPEIQRLQATNSELTQRLADQEGALQRLAAAEAEAKRLSKLPLEREKPPRQYHSLDRRFHANLGNEGEQRIAVLRADYEAAKTEAEGLREGGDRTKLNRATERMILRASQLAEHGILVS